MALAHCGVALVANTHFVYGDLEESRAHTSSRARGRLVGGGASQYIYQDVRAANLFYSVQMEEWIYGSMDDEGMRALVR